jgi:hypothetical protein
MRRRDPRFTREDFLREMQKTEICGLCGLKLSRKDRTLWVWQRGWLIHHVCPERALRG